MSVTFPGINLFGSQPYDVIFYTVVYLTPSSISCIKPRCCLQGCQLFQPVLYDFPVVLLTSPRYKSFLWSDDGSTRHTLAAVTFLATPRPHNEGVIM